MYIVSYDISSSKLRRKVAKELENYGIRVQYSVFECDMDADKYIELYEKMIGLMGDSADGSIRFYNLCLKCRGRTRVIGIEEQDPKDDRDEVIIR